MLQNCHLKNFHVDYEIKHNLKKMIKQVVMRYVVTIYSYIRLGLHYIPSLIYDTLISKMLTNYSYERFLKRIEKHPLPKDRPLRILDIGVGTAVPLYNIWNKLPKSVDVMGVDIDHSYVLKA